MSTNISTARTVARAITLDTQKASTDGRVIELSSEMEAVTTRLGELEKLIAYHSVPRHGDKRVQLAHAKGRLEFRVRTDDQAPPGNTPQPHLQVKELKVYLGWPGQLTASGPQP